MRCDAIPPGLTVAAPLRWTAAALDNGLVIEVEPGRFEDMVVPALDGLPEELGQLMRNVAVTVEHRPGPPGLLGPHEGIPSPSPAAHRSTRGSCPTGSPSTGRRSAPSAAPSRRSTTRSAVPSSTRSPTISALTTTGSANSAGKTRIRSAQMRASAADRVERNGQGARPWPCPRGQSAAGTSASRGRRLTGSPSRRATCVFARPRKEPPFWRKGAEFGTVVCAAPNEQFCRTGRPSVRSYAVWCWLPVRSLWPGARLGWHGT